MPLDLVSGQHRDLLVGSETGGGDVVAHQVRIGHDMEELDDIVVANNSSTTGLGKGLGGENDPVVVLIFVRVPGNLLAWEGRQFMFE